MYREPGTGVIFTAANAAGEQNKQVNLSNRRGLCLCLGYILYMADQKKAAELRC